MKVVLRPLAPVLLLLLAGPALPGDRFVNGSLTTGGDDGSSWADAFRGVDGVARALAGAQAGDRVFVAAGTYLATVTLDRDASHVLPAGVELYGGCLGTESEPDQRPPVGTVLSVLSGDLDGNDGQGDVTGNSRSVVRVLPGAGLDTLLDRFEVRGGNADTLAGGDGNGGGLHVSGSAPTVRDCRFVENRAQAFGGAVYVAGPNAPASFVDCRFEDNRADMGAALFAQDCLNLGVSRAWFVGNAAVLGGTFVGSGASMVNATNAVFRDNRGLAFGAAHAQAGGIVRLTGCTLASNVLQQAGHAAVSHSGTGAVLKNCVVWANPAGPAADTSAPVQLGSSVTSCLVEGGGFPGPNLSGDPRLVDVAGGDLRPAPGSPLIDAGNANYFSNLTTTDVTGGPRYLDDPLRPDVGIGNPVPDVGAFEADWPTLGVTDAGCVPLVNSTGLPALLGLQGSALVADGSLRLVAHQLPTGEFGVFVMARQGANLVTPGGVVCVGLPFYRFAAQIQLSDAWGFAGLDVDPGALPQGQVFLPGESWTFQYWYRDGVGANLSQAVALSWQ